MGVAMLGASGVLDQEVNQFTAFLGAHAFDTDGVLLVHVEAFAPCPRMRAHNRMADWRGLVVRRLVGPYQFPIGVLGMVGRPQIGDPRLNLVGQRVVGIGGAGEHRSAQWLALRVVGNGEGVQAGVRIRHPLVHTICVPVLARVHHADRLAVLEHVRQQRDVGIAGQQPLAFVPWRLMLAQARGEVHMALVAHGGLSSKVDDRIIVERLLDALEGRAVDVLVQVYPPNLGT